MDKGQLWPIVHLAQFSESALNNLSLSLHRNLMVTKNEILGEKISV
jgi:hypothetical protein